jgi:hypothetical protein
MADLAPDQPVVNGQGVCPRVSEDYINTFFSQNLYNYICANGFHVCLLLLAIRKIEKPPVHLQSGFPSTKKPRVKGARGSWFYVIPSQKPSSGPPKYRYYYYGYDKDIDAQAVTGHLLTFIRYI